MGDSTSSSSSKKSMILDNLKTDCATPCKVLENLVVSMIAQMTKGLKGETSDLKMLPSYVYSLPTGYMFFKLKHCSIFFLTFFLCQGLFGFVASGLSEFVDLEFEKYKIPRETKRVIGFTFSFPVNQTSINEGILIEWNKGFNVSDTIGKDVVACLEEAMIKQNLDMFSVTALVNDSVGALAGAIYKNQDVKVAVILGTGSNACYIERMDAIPKIKKEEGDQNHLAGNTIINTEWGAFSQKCLPLTKFDALGTDSDEKGKQIFEKMISGKYLGILVSKILLEMAQSENLFGKGYTAPVLSTEDMNKMQSDKSKELETVGSILNKKVKVETTLAVRTTVVEVIDIVVKRAARLAGAGIVAILKKIEQDMKGTNEKRTVVAIDGSLYEHYEQYRSYFEKVFTDLHVPNVVIEQFPDASGIGAALLAHTNSTVTD
ncbi:hypothetical protein MKX01_036934 [Papaver californicum]|nr:hypothetical protein MKX01_036934 [Papaver californicum]